MRAVVHTNMLITRLSEFLGEGFLADRIIRENNVDLAKEYAKDIANGRSIVFTGVYQKEPIKCLNRYLRFLSWLCFHFGSVKVKNKQEAEDFFNWKLKNVAELSGEGTAFFKWLSAETLNDASGVLYS